MDIVLNESNTRALEVTYNLRNPSGYWFKNTHASDNDGVCSAYKSTLDEDYYFISKERHSHEHSWWYTVRRMDKEGKIYRLSKFKEFKNLAQAKVFLFQLVNDVNAGIRSLDAPEPAMSLQDPHFNEV